MSNDDETRLFLQAKDTSHFDVDPLQWWSVNPKRFSTMTEVGRSVLSAQTTTVFNEGLSSRAGNLISSYRTSLGDVAIEASFCA